MIDLDKAVIARHKAQGASFEILVDCDLALDLRAGKEIDVKDVLASDKVFADAKKALLASETQMKSVFGTEDTYEIARQIINKGEIQLTAEHRKKIQDQKIRQVMDYIHMNAVDPKTGLPHPHTRIELAFNEAGIHIDEHKSADSQIDEIIKKLRPILPLSIEREEIIVRIPAAHAAKAYGVVAEFGKLTKDEWQTDGSWIGGLEMPPGKKPDFFDRLLGLTHGDMETIEERSKK
jgi:ribosome maturation protein SDO1